MENRRKSLFFEPRRRSLLAITVCINVTCGDFLGGCVFTPPVSVEIIGAEFLLSEIERRIIPLLRKSAASETISPSFPPRSRNAGFRLGNESRTAPEYTLSSRNCSCFRANVIGANTLRVVASGFWTVKISPTHVGGALLSPRSEGPRVRWRTASFRFQNTPNVARNE